MIQKKILSKMQSGYQMQNLMLILNPLEKLKKMHAKNVINKKVTEKLSVTLITVCKNFWPITFFE